MAGAQLELATAATAPTAGRPLREAGRRARRPAAPANGRAPLRSVAIPPFLADSARLNDEFNISVSLNQ